VPDPSGGRFLWATTATALGTGATDSIGPSEWATPRVLAKDGQDAFGGNLFPDPLNRTFAVNANGWSVEGGVTVGSGTSSVGFAEVMLRIDAGNANTGGILTPHFPVESGMFYRVGAWCGQFGEGQSATTNLHIRWYTDDAAVDLI